MKRMIYLLAAVLLMATGCEKDNDRFMDNIVGEWHFSGTESGVAEDVWLSLNADSTFEMYQKVGSGPYWHSTGEYAIDLETRVMTGIYSDRYPWKYTYKVNVDSKSMLMTAMEVEGYSVGYARESIPEEVRGKSLPLTKSEPVERYL